jgi:hypothetical protein
MNFQQPNITLPPQGSPPGDASLTSPHAILGWLERLPANDPPAAAARLFSTLVRLNGYILEPAARFRVLERVRDPHAELRQALRQHYSSDHLPLSGSASQRASVVRRLDDAMATGYKLVIADLCGNSDASMLYRRRTMPLAVYRAMSHLVSSVADAYEVYIPPPPTLWHDLHQLYDFAVTNKLQSCALKQVATPADATPSIESLYKGILLLSLASPFRLHNRDIERLLPNLHHWAALCQLAKPRAESLPGWPVGIKHGHDRNPGYRLLDAESCHQEAWYLDTEPLAMQLQCALRNAEFLPATDANLYKRLIASWGIRSPRRFNRTAASARVEASLGLQQLHQLFNLSNTARRFSSNAVASGAITGWTPTVAIWRMKDRSPGGYRLSLQQGQNAHTRVGELIGVRGYPTKSLAAGGWLVGVVRWLRNRPGSDLEAGVEWLAPRAEAVTVNPLLSDGQRGTPLHGLVLPEVRIFDRDATLVTPPSLSGWQASMTIAGNQRGEISIQGQEEDTGEHARFWIKQDTATV